MSTLEAIWPQTAARVRDEAARQRILTALPAILLGGGALLRIFHYLVNRSLWVDEAALSLNIAQRGYVALMQPLNPEQYAPLGFLWLERTAVLAFGNNEYALRLFPLIFGLLSLPLFYALVKRVLPPELWAVAAGLFAFSYSLVHFTTQVKQYSLDVLIALAVFYLALHLLDSHQQESSQWSVVSEELRLDSNVRTIEPTDNRTNESTNNRINEQSNNQIIESVVSGQWPGGGEELRLDSKVRTIEPTDNRTIESVVSGQWPVGSEKLMFDSNVRTNEPTDNRTIEQSNQWANDYLPLTDYRPLSTDHFPPTDYRPLSTDHFPPAARYLLALGVLGVLAVWFSHPSVFVLAGTGLTLAVVAIRHRNWLQLLKLAGIGGAWLASFGAVYWLMLRRETGSEYLQDFWQRAFMPLPPTSFADLLWFVTTPYELLRFPGNVIPVCGAVAMAAGAWYLWRAARRKELLLLVAPFGFALLASGLHKYPMENRLLLFLVPALLLVMAHGVGFVLRRHKLAGWALAATLFIYPAGLMAYNLARPRNKEEIKPVLSYLAQQKQTGDVIYGYYGAQLAWIYYAEKYGLGAEKMIVGARMRGDWTTYRQDLDKLKGQPRVWVLFSHVKKEYGADEEKLTLQGLDERGRQLAAFSSAGAAIYLYDLR